MTSLAYILVSHGRLRWPSDKTHLVNNRLVQVTNHTILCYHGDAIYMLDYRAFITHYSSTVMEVVKKSVTIVTTNYYSCT